jgi:UDPglucose 6-dehydrogenase
VKFAADAYEAISGADACLILTEWEDFSALDLRRIKELLRYPIVIDGRNLFKPAMMLAAGLNYYSVGRADVVSSRAAVAPYLKQAIEQDEAA